MKYLLITSYKISHSTHRRVFLESVWAAQLLESSLANSARQKKSLSTGGIKKGVTYITFMWI